MTDKSSEFNLCIQSYMKQIINYQDNFIEDLPWAEKP